MMSSLCERAQESHATTNLAKERLSEKGNFRKIYIFAITCVSWPGGGWRKKKKKAKEEKKEKERKKKRKEKKEGEKKMERGGKRENLS